MIRKSTKIPAYLTIYLSLTLGVLLTLCLALIEGIRLSTFQLETACIADVGMDSILAEYHRALFQRYNLLALDSSYGTETFGRTNLEGRLAWYLDKNMTMQGEELTSTWTARRYKDFLRMHLDAAEITDFRLLSDEKGKTFHRLAVEAIKSDVGLSAAREVMEWMEVVEEYHLDTRDVEAEKLDADSQIAAYQGTELEDEEIETLEFDNPTDVVEDAKKTGLLKQVLRDKRLSGKRIDQTVLISERAKRGKCNHGNMPEQNPSAFVQTADNLLFHEYMLSYFGNYREPKEESALDYEIEYVLMGKDSDKENLQKVLYRLLEIREAANATYLFSDSVKYAEAEVIAATVCTVTLQPELIELLTTSILLGWAYVESIYDLRVLINGGKIPLMKNSESWHYGLSGVISGLWEDVKDGDEKQGLSYEDYLRLLLVLAGEEKITARAMNVVEADVRKTQGNKAFRLDACYVQVKTMISVSSKYGYHLRIREDKGY